MLEEFTKYYETFKKQKAIEFKYYHSLRVMNLSLEIGKSLGLNSEQLNVVKLIGLLHDYSRFEQWDKYNSFHDLTTFDHGTRASQLLFDGKEIEKYHLSKKYYKIVYDAIKNHNKYKISDIGKDSLIYCQIIRDADKLDIIQQFKKSLFYKNNKFNIIHSEVEKQFFEHKPIRKINEETINDNLLIKIALIYDLNFEYSFRYVKEKQLIDKMGKQLDRCIFQKYIDEIRIYLDDKINKIELGIETAK